MSGLVTFMVDFFKEISGFLASETHSAGGVPDAGDAASSSLQDNTSEGSASGLSFDPSVENFAANDNMGAYYGAWGTGSGQSAQTAGYALADYSAYVDTQWAINPTSNEIGSDLALAEAFGALQKANPLFAVANEGGYLGETSSWEWISNHKTEVSDVPFA